VGIQHPPPGKTCGAYINRSRHCRADSQATWQGNMEYKIRIRIKGVLKMYISVHLKDARHLYYQSQYLQYVGCKGDSGVLRRCVNTPIA